jgi:signal transduction histidine kinase
MVQVGSLGLIGSVRDWLPRLTVIGLGIAGVLPPLVFVVEPVDLGGVAAVPIAIVLTVLLIVMPAMAGLAAALLGLDGVREGFRVRGDKEHEQAVLRVFVGVVLVGYTFALAATPPVISMIAACQIAASLGLAGAWLLLLLAMLDPGTSPLRRHGATIFDAAIVSAFLHYGGDLTAAWQPLYLLASFYVGLRFGPAAFAAATIAGLAGFASVIATTPFWQRQAMLAAGLWVALAILPAVLARIMREIAAARAEAMSARTAQKRFLSAIGEALHAPFDATGHPAADAMRTRLADLVDFAAIEAGALAPATEPFDLHRVVNDALAPRRMQAIESEVRLRVRIDPQLPYRLRGWPRQFGQIVDQLAGRAIEAPGVSAVHVALDAAEDGARRAQLRLVVRDDGQAAGEAPALVERLVALMRGTIAAHEHAVTVTLPLAIDDAAMAGEPNLDLRNCVVLIATEDGEFAGDLAAPLAAWQGDPRWIDGFDGTLGFDRLDAGACSVLIVDGRQRLLPALSFAHRAVTGAAGPSFTVLIAEAAQVDGVVELSDGALDAVLPARADHRLLATALRALPLWRSAPARPIVMSASADAPTPAAAPQVTPISAHPRFGAEAAVVDARAIAALRGLGAGDGFLGEIVDAFRTDAAQIMQRISRAAAAGDSGGFGRGLLALRSCAANLGGTRLSELLLSLREIGARELAEQGGALVDRLGDELRRFETALLDFLPEPADAQSGA